MLILPVTSSHYESILCPCGDLKFLARKTFFLNHKAVIPTSSEWTETKRPQNISTYRVAKLDAAKRETSRNQKKLRSNKRKLVKNTTKGTNNKRSKIKIFITRLHSRQILYDKNSQRPCKHKMSLIRFEPQTRVTCPHHID